MRTTIFFYITMQTSSSSIHSDMFKPSPPVQANVVGLGGVQNSR